MYFEYTHSPPSPSPFPLPLEPLPSPLPLLFYVFTPSITHWVLLELHCTHGCGAVCWITATGKQHWKDMAPPPTPVSTVSQKLLQRGGTSCAGSLTGPKVQVSSIPSPQVPVAWCFVVLGSRPCLLCTRQALCH